MSESWWPRTHHRLFALGGMFTPGCDLRRRTIREESLRSGCRRRIDSLRAGGRTRTAPEERMPAEGSPELGGQLLGLHFAGLCGQQRDLDAGA